MKKQVRSREFLVFATLVVLLTLWMIRPFILPVLTAAVLAVIFRPIHSFIRAQLRHKDVSAFITTLLILCFFILPFLIVFTVGIAQFNQYYDVITQTTQSVVQQYSYGKYYSGLGFAIDLKNIASRFSSAMLLRVEHYISTLPKQAFQWVITFVFLFFFIRDADKILRMIRKYLPLPENDKDQITEKMRNTIDAVVIGQIVTSIIQTILATLAFIILGVPAPFLWGLLTLFISIIPVIGPGFIYVPLSIALVVHGLLEGSSGVWRGIVLLLFGIIIQSFHCWGCSAD